MRAIWCGFALGVIALQQQARLPALFLWLFLLLIATLALAGAWRAFALASLDDARWRLAGWALVCLAAACAGFGYGAWRAQLRLGEALPAQWESRDIEVEGYVASLPSLNEAGASLRFAVQSWAGQAPARTHWPSLIQLSWIARDAPLPVLEPGSRWRLTVRAKRPHSNGNFGVRDAQVALLARNVRATAYVSAPQRAVRLRDDARGVAVAIERWRARIRSRIEGVLADAPHRGIVVALATGAQDDISDDDWTLMRRTGTSHLVAIAGLHLAIVAGLAGWAAGAAWRRARLRGVGAPLVVPAQSVEALAALGAAALYATLAGFNVPVQRALWMLVVAAVVRIGGRNVARSHALAWALGLVLLLDPWAVTAVGFWLSFGAVGAILYALAGAPPRVMARADRVDLTREEADHPPDAVSFATLRAAAVPFVRRLAARCRSSAQVQWAVTIALAPLTAYWFAQIPLIGPFANAVAIPWVSAAVAPLALAGVMLPAPLDAWAFVGAHQLLVWLAKVLAWFAAPSWAALYLAQPGAWALFCAAVGVAWCLAPRGWPLRWAAPFMWLPLLMPGQGAPPPGSYRLSALDIGQGTAVLVQTARHTLLFDAGPGPESTRAGERIVVPYLQAHGIGVLDALFVSHGDADHSGGAPAVLDAVPVRQFVAGLMPAHALWKRARAAGAEALRCAAGQRWQWDGVDFEVLWPDPRPLSGRPNEHSCVLRVAGRDRRVPGALIAADIEAGVERTLIARDAKALRADVLVVPHHGSRTSSTEPFLDSVWPLVALFQVGYLNRFHHPHPGVFARYTHRKIVLARSDVDGAVRIDATPGALRVERYRESHLRYWMERDDAAAPSEQTQQAGSETTSP